MKNLVTFCQTSSVLSGYESGGEVIKEVSKKVTNQLDELEAEFGGTWQALQVNSPRAIINFLEPIFANLSVSERQELATDIIFTDSEVFDWTPTTWHFCERRNDFIFDVLDVTFSYQRAVALYQEIREYLAESCDSPINSILKNTTAVYIADQLINYASALHTGFYDPGFNLVGKGARELSKYFEPKNIGELIDVVSISMVKALFLAESGEDEVWHILAKNSAENIRELSKSSARGHNAEYLLVWLAVLSFAQEHLPEDDDDFLPDEVPNLVGMRLSEAKRLCEAFEIKIMIVDDPGVLKDSNWKVVSLSPQPGTTLRKHRRISLEIKK